MEQSNFQFDNPHLVELSFIENNEFQSNENELAMKNSFRVQIKRSSIANCAVVALAVEISFEDGKGPFQLKIRLESNFKWKKMEEDILEKMLKCNAPALLLSYMRPIISNITSASKFPTYNLPFVNFSEQIAVVEDMSN